MPAVAVVGGIASAAGAATAFAAATTTIGSIAAGLAFVGGVATALGGITGNKKLMKFGMITGLSGAAVGGIASLASSASDAAASATTLSAGDAGIGLSAKAAGEGLRASGVGLEGIGVEATTSSGGLLSSLDTGVSRLTTESAGAQAINRIAESAAASAPAVSYALPSPSTLNAPSSFASNTSSVMADATAGLSAPTMPDTGSSAFGNFGKLIQKNPELVKAGTGILSGIGQAKMQQEQMDWKERTEAERRARINSSILGQRSNF